MTPPITAKDPDEGFCEECTDWYAWAELEACSDCAGTLCADHVDRGDHDCPGPEPER